MTIPSALSRWWHGGTDPADERDSSTTSDAQAIDRKREADRAVVRFHGPVHQPANVRAFEDVLRHAPRDEDDPSY